MIILEGLKHNQFKEVSIPRPSELVKSYGLTTDSNKYSGEEFVDPSKSKIESIEEVAQEVFEPEND